MPNNNGQQKNNLQNIQLEKYEENEIKSRAESRQQQTNFSRADWKKDRLAKIDADYTDEILSNRIEEQKGVIERKYSKLLTDYVGYLRGKWETSDREKTLNDIQAKIDEIIKETDEKLKAEKILVEEKYNKKILTEQEKLKQWQHQKKENDAESSTEKCAERANQKNYIRESREILQLELNKQYELYNKKGTSEAEKKACENFMHEAEEKFKQFNDEEYALNQKEEELQKKKTEIDKVIKEQEEKISNLENAKQEAWENKENEIKNLSQNRIENWQETKEAKKKWLYDWEARDEYSSELNKQEEKELENVPIEVKAQFEKEKAAKIAQLERDVKSLEERHNKGLDFYKELDKIQSTKKKVGSDTDEFKQMINSLKQCADAMLENTVGKEADENLLKLAEDAYRKCQFYRSEKKGAFGGFRWSRVGDKRRTAAKEFSNKLLEICPGLREKLGLEAENVNNKKGSQSDKNKKTREPVKFPELDKKDIKKNTTSKKSAGNNMEKAGKANSK